MALKWKENLKKFFMYLERFWGSLDPHPKKFSRRTRCSIMCAKESKLLPHWWGKL